MATWQIFLLLVIAYFIYKAAILPQLRKKYPNTFKTPVQIKSLDQVIGKYDDGTDMTYNNLRGNEEVVKALDFMDAGDYRSAVMHFKFAMDFGIKKLFGYRANCVHAMGYYVESVEDMDKAIAEEPEDPELYFFRAFYRTDTGNFAGNDEDRRRSFELIRTDSEINRKRNEEAVKAGYSSLQNKYEHLFGELDEKMKFIRENGAPKPNEGSVAFSNVQN